jgi:hypothetical protein
VRPSRREQLVAAAIAGMVVIILGFASGIGVNVTRSSAAGVQPSQAETTEPASPMPMEPGSSTAPPVNYVGVPIAGPVETTAPVGVAAPPPSTTSPSASPTPKTVSHVASASPSKPPAPVTTCSTDLVSSLLNALIGSPAQGLGALLPLGGPLSLLAEGLGLQLPALPLSSLLSQVTDLLPALLALPVAGRPTSSSPALAASCTTAVSKFLPIPGLGG